MKSMQAEIVRLLSSALFAIALLGESTPGAAQAACSAAGYRVVGRRWDAVLKKDWELRQDCAHPEWPARVAATSPASSLAKNGTVVSIGEVQHLVQPLLVHAGESVRLWMQDDRVRIEMSGVAEQSAHAGERVLIRVLHQTDDAGITVERIAGIVRGTADVEMER